MAGSNLLMAGDKSIRWLWLSQVIPNYNDVDPLVLNRSSTTKIGRKFLGNPTNVAWFPSMSDCLGVIDVLNALENALGNALGNALK